MYSRPIYFARFEHRVSRVPVLSSSLLNLIPEFGVNFENLFAIKDADGNTILMELAKTMKDEALREVLTNSATSNYITHSVLLSKNTLGQTLLTIAEVPCPSHSCYLLSMVDPVLTRAGTGSRPGS